MTKCSVGSYPFQRSLFPSKSSARLGWECSSGAISTPEYFAKTFLGRSKQSFFLCVIAPQFSHAPFRNLVAILVYKMILKIVKLDFIRENSKKNRKHFIANQDTCIFTHELNLIVFSYRINTTFIPLVQTRILLLAFFLDALMA